jgi:hypothetical protein
VSQVEPSVPEAGDEDEDIYIATEEQKTLLLDRLPTLKAFHHNRGVKFAGYKKYIN